MSFIIDPGELLRRKSAGIEAIKAAYKAYAMGEIPWERFLVDTEHEMRGDCFELMCDFARRASGEGKDPTKFRQAAIRIACRAVL